MRKVGGYTALLLSSVAVGCSPYPHDLLTDYRPKGAVPIADVHPTPQDFELPENNGSPPDTKKEKPSSLFLFYEVMPDGSRRLPINATGTPIDYNSQIVIIPNKKKLEKLSEELWSANDRHIMKLLHRLTHAQNVFLKANQQGRPGASASQLAARYDAFRLAASTNPSLAAVIPARDTAIDPGDPNNAATLALKVQDVISAAITNLNNQAMSKAQGATFSIKATLTSSGKTTPAPVHVDGYDNIAGTVDVAKSQLAPTSAPSADASKLNLDLALPEETVDQPETVDQLGADIAQELNAIKTMSVRSPTPSTGPRSRRPTTAPSTEPVEDFAQPLDASDKSMTTLKAATDAAKSTPDPVWSFSPGKAPRGIIDLRATSADKGNILQVYGVLTSPTSATAAGTATADATKQTLGDPFDFSVERLDLSLKLSGGVIFVNQLHERTDFAPAPAAAISLHYRPRVDSDPKSPEADKNFKLPDPFWNAWNAIDPGIGLNVAALNLAGGTGSTTSTKMAGTGTTTMTSNTTSSHAVQLGIGVQLSFIDDLLQVGYGYDFETSKHPRYWFVGISVLDALNKIGNLNISTK